MNKAEGNPALPDLETQIEYVKHLRKDVLPRIHNLQIELNMITAIEQSLIAVKILNKDNTNIESKNLSSISNSEANEILNVFKIKVTAVRVDVVKAMLSRKSGHFTISEIHKAVSKLRPVSKSAIITTILLFKNKGLVSESKVREGSSKRIGRPETKYKFER